jgi:outer membrane protein assembly factor BamB
MQRVLKCLTVLAVLVLIAQSQALGENWPGWRGPRGDGVSLETGVPTKWSGVDNVAWKTPIPGTGHSSPIVWGDRIFLTSVLVKSKDRILLSLDRKTGKILWQRTVVNAPLEDKHTENSYASSTPVTDGENVYVTFLDSNRVVVAAYDFSGEPKWIARPGRFDSPWGFCHSPVLSEDKVLVACYGKTSGFVAALNRVDGKKVWCVEPKKSIQSFGSPLVGKMAGRVQMIVPGNNAVTSFDPKDGKELWTTVGPAPEFVATPVFNAKAGLVLCGSSWPNRILVAIKPDGHGNVTSSKVVWKTPDGAPYVPSPIATGDYFLTSSSKKALYCYDASRGDILWKRENMGLHHASPVVVNGLVYFLNDDGVMNIVKAGPTFELVARNELGESTYASPAISQGQIFLRSLGNLYCIGHAK